MGTRRSFLHSALTLAAMSSLRVHASQAHGPLGKPVGLQIYTVREAAAKDLAGTLKTIADIGYGEIELAGQPSQPVGEFRKLANDCGLTVPSMHTSMGDLQTNAQERIEYAKALGAGYLVCSFPWTRDSRFKTNVLSIAAGMTLDDWKWNAEQLNRVGELARKSGVRCAYHNHNMEFRSFDGVVAFDELLRQTDPALVAIELDIGWVVTAGADPLQYLRKHADRIDLLHVKDVRKDFHVVRDKLEAQTTEVGAGRTDWKALFAAMNPQRIRHYFVEQENFERAPLEAAKISFDYLHKLGGKLPG